MEDLIFECSYDDVKNNDIKTITENIKQDNVRFIKSLLENDELFVESEYRSFSLKKGFVEDKKKGISFTYNIKKNVDNLSNKIFSLLGEKRSIHTEEYKATNKIFLMTVLSMVSDKNMYLLRNIDMVILRNGTDKTSITFITMNECLDIPSFERIIITSFKFPYKSYFTKKKNNLLIN